MNEMSCYIMEILGFDFTSTPSVIFLSYSINHKQYQYFILFS